MLLCRNCRDGTYILDDAPCTVCPNTTYRGCQLCDLCTIILDQCSKCRSDLKLNIDYQTTAEINEVVQAHKSAIAAAEAQFAEDISPYKEAVETFESSYNATNHKFDQMMGASNERPSAAQEVRDAIDAIHAAFEPYYEPYLIACDKRYEAIGLANWNYDQAMQAITERLKPSSEA